MYVEDEKGEQFAVLNTPGKQIALETFASNACAFTSAVLAIYATGAGNCQPQSFVKMEDLLTIAGMAMHIGVLREDCWVENWQLLADVVCNYYKLPALKYYWSATPSRFCVGNVADKHFVFVSHTAVDDLRAGTSKTIAKGFKIKDYRCWRVANANC